MPLPHFVLYTIMASATLVGAIRYKRLSISSRRMWALLLITFIVELLAYYVGHIYRTNKIVYNFFLSVQFALFVFAYIPELFDYRRWLWTAIGGGIAGGIIMILIYRNELTTYYISILKTGLDIPSVVIVLLYLRTLLKQPTIYSLGEFPLFWISVGWLLLIMLSSVGLGTFNYITNHAEEYAMLFQQIRMVADYQLYLLFVVAFLSGQRSLGQPNG